MAPFFPKLIALPPGTPKSARPAAILPTSQIFTLATTSATPSTAHHRYLAAAALADPSGSDDDSRTFWPQIQSAVDWLRGRQVLSDRQLSRLITESEAGGLAAADQQRAALNDRLNRAIQESVLTGDSHASWQQRASQIVDLTAREAEAIGRTFTHRAYHEGLREITEEPRIADEFPYIEYMRTHDTRTRATHREMDGKVAHVGSPLAARMRELAAEWGCRCSVVPLSREDAVAAGIDDNTGWVEASKLEPESQSTSASESESMPAPSLNPLPASSQSDTFMDEFFKPTPPTPAKESLPKPARPEPKPEPEPEPLVTIKSGHEEIDRLKDKLLGGRTQNVAKLVGAPSNASITIEPGIQSNAGGIGVTITSPDYRSVRVVGVDKDGSRYIENVNFYVKTPGQGLGTKVLADQVANAQAMGFTKIKTFAAGSGPNSFYAMDWDGENGYYTWPRLGFDGNIPDTVARKLPPEFKGAKRVSDLMATTGGREWWKLNGEATEMEFDLTPGSESTKTLAEYLNTKKLSHSIQTTTPSSTKSGAAEPRSVKSENAKPNSQKPTAGDEKPIASSKPAIEKPKSELAKTRAANKFTETLKQDKEAFKKAVLWREFSANYTAGNNAIAKLAKVDFGLPITEIDDARSHIREATQRLTTASGDDAAFWKWRKDKAEQLIAKHQSKLDKREKAISEALHVPEKLRANITGEISSSINDVQQRNAKRAQEDMSRWTRARKDTDYNIPFKRVDPASGDRSHFKTSENTVYLDDFTGATTAHHELGHALEKSDKSRDIALHFRNTRFGYHDPKPMNELVPGNDFTADEVSRGEDDMVKLFKAFGYSDEEAKIRACYVGKVYPDGVATEITSMGVELMKRDPVLFAKTDPEYFKAVLAVLHGVNE